MSVTQKNIFFLSCLFTFEILIFRAKSLTMSESEGNKEPAAPAKEDETAEEGGRGTGAAVPLEAGKTEHLGEGKTRQSKSPIARLRIKTKYYDPSPLPPIASDTKPPARKTTRSSAAVKKETSGTKKKKKTGEKRSKRSSSPANLCVTRIKASTFVTKKELPGIISAALMPLINEVKTLSQNVSKGDKKNTSAEIELQIEREKTR